MKNELLSPAGSIISAYAAIQNGCDAIYLAGKMFGARKTATNFDEEELKTIIPYAHAYGVKIYVTLNTLIHDDEMEKCKKYVDMLYHLGVDALIVQDLGIISYIRMTYPDFDVHASTQMHVHNKHALEFLMNQNIPRAVLAREVTFDEIKELSKEDIELEVFVHGALCVCYSGQCLMSYMVGKRSGNRGECAQICRRPYTLIDYNSKEVKHKEAYLLSLKDLNTLDEINEMMKYIDSFKIEGRLKKPEYVAYATYLYANKMKDKNFKMSSEQLENLKTIFNREYTKGHLFNCIGSDLYNPIRPNHIGIEVGTVIDANKKSIKVKLDKDLAQNDGIRILQRKEDVGFTINKMYNDKGLLISKGYKGETVRIDVHDMIYKGNKVLKTNSPALLKEIDQTFDKNYRKVSLSCKLIVEVDKPLVLHVFDGLDEVVTCSEEVVQKALKRASTTDEIKKQLNKTKDTIFEFNKIDIEMNEDCFIPNKQLNQLRRDALDKMYDIVSKRVMRNHRSFNMNEVKEYTDSFKKIAKVRNEQQLCICMQEGLDLIYVEDQSLYEKYKDTKIVRYEYPRVYTKEYDEYGMIQEVGGLTRNTFDTDTGLNVYNAKTLYFLHSIGANIVTLSYELEFDHIKQLMKSYKDAYHKQPNACVVVYGRNEVMVSKHCPIQSCLVDNGKKHCNLCRNKTFALKDIFGNEYPMFNDENCNMHLFNDKIIDRTNEISYLKEIGIHYVRYDFTWESEEEIINILRK